MRQLSNNIRSILMAHWDPIGVRDESQAADEYDGYLAGLCGLISRDASAADIADHLLRIERRDMGLPGDVAGANNVAMLLAELGARR